MDTYEDTVRQRNSAISNVHRLHYQEVGKLFKVGDKVVDKIPDNCFLDQRVYKITNIEESNVPGSNRRWWYAEFDGDKSCSHGFECFMLATEEEIATGLRVTHEGDESFRGSQHP